MRTGAGRWTSRSGWLTGALLIAGGLAAAAPADAGGRHQPWGSGRPVFVERECWWPIPDSVSADTTITCGTVAVPANRSRRRSRSIELAVARIHREGSDPDEIPIVALHGGPGGSLLQTAPVGLATLPSLDDRDVIAFDQRGAGRSLPSLNCPEKEEAILTALSAAAPWPVELEANRRALRACRRRLVHAGIDLDDYDTPASVADMESIRQAFGIRTWHLFGGSYGTRLALAYAREHPRQVRSLLLDSVYPPDVGGVQRTLGLPQRAIDGLVAACADDAGCNAAQPDLGATIDAAAASFDADPATLEASYGFGGEVVTRSFTLTGADLRGGLFSALYRTDLIPLLPVVAGALASGNRGILPLFISLGVPQLLQLSEGAYLSVDCADSQRLQPPRLVRRALPGFADDGMVLLSFAVSFCEVWDVRSVPASFLRPVVVDTPTLIFAGTLDPITPYEDSVAQAARMPNARLVSAPRGGHGAATFDACTFSAMLGFWEDPEAPLPACVDELEPRPLD